MSVGAAIFVPVLVCALFAVATYEQWRRMGRADHAASWLWAFVVVGAGWATTAIEAVLAIRFVFPGAALALCWFAAALLGARGVRQRAEKPDRGVVMLAIWVGTAIGVSLLQDLALSDPMLRSSMAMVVIAGGGALAAVAVGPRHRHASPSAWIGALICGLFASLCLTLAIVALRFPSVAMLEFTSSLFVPLLVLCGVVIMSCLNEDRAQALERLARTDALTGVWNRRGFEEGARHLLDRFRASGGTAAAVAIADIDGFKGINDGHGHAVGDATLARFAETLRSATGSGDLLARLGGEEFAILAIGVDGPVLRQRMDRVRSLLTVASIDPQGMPAITASFGVASLDADHRSLRDALERADRALYRAKSEGRNRVTLAE
ncbi:GGDEF domain-containing protein [Sphingomonas sp. BIUV-7]|uniref:diguanylate cyclase n=1 Tax=Sphingomonas natans TaxID=3063330 RepID=A0ABT8Y627_9SPHN|nr:GGDEF domain-containing protein [Sphingomonas sp. BIUV-7]MDO6413368.1 GGDEF domain-containing protein [Sphingomonas sp. BIUV-7]